MQLEKRSQALWHMFGKQSTRALVLGCAHDDTALWDTLGIQTILAVDTDPAVIDAVTNAARQCQVDACVCDMTSPDAWATHISGTFDAISCMVVQSVPQDMIQPLFERVASVLRPGGLFFGTTTVEMFPSVDMIASSVGLTRIWTRQENGYCAFTFVHS